MFVASLTFYDILPATVWNCVNASNIENRPRHPIVLEYYSAVAHWQHIATAVSLDWGSPTSDAYRHAKQFGVR